MLRRLPGKALLGVCDDYHIILGDWQYSQSIKLIKSLGIRDILKPENADLFPAVTSLRKNRILLQAT